MSHSLANLEWHQFKYAQFRRPGDVHVHFFGTATLSFSDGFRTEAGDEFEIEASPFTLPLRNRLVRSEEDSRECVCFKRGMTMRWRNVDGRTGGRRSNGRISECRDGKARAFGTCPTGLRSSRSC